MENYFETNFLLTDKQFGFRKGLSPEIAIHGVVDNLYRVLDERKLGLGVFLDIRKAFDSVNGEIFLHKLKSYGILNIELEWFRSFLFGRKQFVCNDKEISFMKNVILGIPQGSSIFL